MTKTFERIISEVEKYNYLKVMAEIDGEMYAACTIETDSNKITLYDCHAKEIGTIHGDDTSLEITYSDDLVTFKSTICSDLTIALYGEQW